MEEQQNQITTFRQFHDKVRELAECVEETYIFVDVSSSYLGKFTFRCYINKYGYTEGNTADECIELLKEKLPKQESDRVDIIISDNQVEETNKTMLETDSAPLASYSTPPVIDSTPTVIDPFGGDTHVEENDPLPF